MKISAINSNLYINRGQTSSINKSLMCTPSFAVPNDTVSFSGTSRYFVDDIREVPDLPCGCCGKNMLRNSKVNEFLEKKLYYPADIALRKLKSEGYYSEKNATWAMKEAYAFLRDYAAKNPKLTISEILAKRAVKSKRATLPHEVSEAFDTFREMSKLVSRNSKYMVTEISKLNPDFHKVEKKVFKELKRLAKKYPNENFNEILNKPEINSHYLKKLQAKQLRILAEVDEISKKLDPLLQAKTIKITKNARGIFKHESPEILHKRGRVISNYYSVLKPYEYNPTVREILSTINNLPNSMTDVDAFMVKGSQKTANAIAEILVTRQRNTFEHVKPRKRENDNGANSIYNYIGLCGKCNAERQRTEYDIFIKSHPEMPKNEQRQIDKIIYFINSGQLIGYDDYPTKIKESLNTESKGNLIVNIEKYDADKAKNSRKIRQQLYIALKKAEGRARKKQRQNISEI